MRIGGIDYIYNYKGRKPIYNELSVFLYGKLAHHKDVRNGMWMYVDNNDNYDVTTLLSEIRKRYNTIYCYGFPRHIKMTIDKANKLLRKRNLPFEIVPITKNKNMIEDMYILQYTGEFEIYNSSSYSIISALDGMYCLLDSSNKLSPLMASKMKDLSKLLEKLRDTVCELKIFIPGDFNNIDDINGMLSKLELPFSIRQVFNLGDKEFFIERTNDH